ncbi:hypothetical protein LSM04_008043 [Trypanosoma melophagium]|uniref:uncharacterized protein n=1 Tax=Trypanosoma melophagium TaxID=715481 RepID=UPI003519FF74|nr:hypothetical protein LSM04_008043 [Trypanosoma melophagium]
MNRPVECPQLQPGAIASPLPSAPMSTCSSWAILDSACSSQPPRDLYCISTQSPSCESAMTPAVCAMRFTAAASSSPCGSFRDVYAGGSPSEWSMLFVDHSPTRSECGTRDSPAAELDAAVKSTNTINTTTAAAEAEVSDVKGNDERERTSTNARGQYFSFREFHGSGLPRYSAFPFVSHCGLHNTAALQCSKVLFAGRNEWCAVVNGLFANSVRKWDNKDMCSLDSDADSSVQSMHATSSCAPSVVNEETPVKYVDYSTDEIYNQGNDTIHTPVFNMMAFRAILRLAALMFIGEVTQAERRPRCERRDVANVQNDGWCSIGHWVASNLESLALSALHGIIVFVL